MLVWALKMMSVANFSVELGEEHRAHVHIPKEISWSRKHVCDGLRAHEFLLCATHWLFDTECNLATLLDGLGQPFL